MYASLDCTSAAGITCKRHSSVASSALRPPRGELICRRRVDRDAWSLGSEDKAYVHAYDARVGACLEPGSRVYEFGNTKGLGGFFAWRRDRVRSEMLMHVLHAIRAVRWVQ